MRPMTLVLVAALVLALVGASARADESFLEVGHDYMIRFSTEDDPFVVSKSGIASTTIGTADGKTEPGQPAFWTMKATVQFFSVIAIGPRSWVRVEVPTEVDDIPKWNLKRQSMAQLTEGNIAELSATDAGKARLQAIRDAAEQKIEVLPVWINLDHALVISDVPTELKTPQLNVNITPTPGKQNKQNEIK